MGTSSQSNWQTEDQNYDPAKFYTNSTDKRGHGETIHAKLPPQYHGMLAELVENANLPYKTMADFIRDAIVHRIYYLIEHQADLEAAYRMDAIATAHRIHHAQARYQEEVTQMTELQQQLEVAVREGRRAHDDASVRHLLTTTLTDVENFRDPFRSQFIGWIQRQLADLPQDGAR